MTAFGIRHDAGAALSSVATWPGRLAAGLLRPHQERQALRHLLSLDDSLLRDINVSRDDLRRRVGEDPVDPFFREPL